MDEFSVSCGASSPLRLDVTGPGPRHAVRCVFEQPYVLIGRDLGNDLRLDHDQVSRRHAYLQMMAGRVFCVDLGSRTGLWWNNRSCTAGWLDNPMQIGPYRLLLPDRASYGTDSVLDWNPLDMPAADQRILPRVTLEVVFESNGKPAFHFLDRMLTLAGRSPACKLHVPDLSLSRHHCSFLLTADGVWVIDLFSREGVVVNGQRVKWACLRPGDRLELGRVIVHPHYEGPVPKSPAISAPIANAVRSRTISPASDPELPVFFARQAAGGPMAPSRTMVAAPTAFQPTAVPSFDFKSLEEAGPQTALLVPVLQQFSLMQQQMMDQFHQSMQMMVQVFASMHRDQMQMLQGELDHIHRITRELQELQAQAQKSVATGNVATASPIPPPPAATTMPAKETPAAPQTTVIPPTPPMPSPKSTPDPSFTASPRTDEMPHAGEMHDWLNQRIFNLQRERESRWQKIMGFVLGK